MKQLHVLISAFSCLLCLVVVDSITHPRDVEALKNLKRSIERKSITMGSCLSSWDFSVDPCDHIFSARFTCGIRCDFSLAGLSRVTEIALDSAGYSGELTNITWLLPYLHTLDLSGNSLSGSLPESLSNLIRLRQLSLSRNSFSLSIPTSIGSLPYLEELYLDDNKLSGSIPPSLNKLSHLKNFAIQQNQLSGEFPFLGSLSNLNSLDASNNNISSIGTNPLSLPISLISFSMRNNSLKGEMPRQFLHMRYLEVLDLSYNELVGAITGEIFEHPSLQQLSFSHNQFSAVISPSGNVRRGRKMVAVDLSYNKINGLLPKFLAELPNLSALSLEHNRFTGMIPSGYAFKVRTASLQRLLLGGNYLFGPIPDPLKRVEPGSAKVSLVDNCLYTCPDTFFFCQGGEQKSLIQCKSLRHTIP
ncbi:LRR receptor-like serine/threonine-protein kinase ERECTA [Beta vulgaris subsp. vulgaris]|uniref:LRR receptor-like serine/threonine-protein kinase ERECTA n=1 Tax=Beta vulgaris subsp. vulgaris TaxID=3555 RepID=UPI0005401E90|nr:LRR receptor-like serine/threonine-protein kinase ERECTA [Beta vulgaris subsp. vulgaris]